MEGRQASDGSRYWNGALQDVLRQAAGEETLAQKLQREQETKRNTRRQGKQRPSIAPFAPGRNSLDGKSTIPAASTGSQRGSLLSAAPIPKTRPRKVPDENAQAGPSNSRPEAQIIAGSRKKLNLNQIETSEEDWVIQGDSAPHTRWAASHQDMDAGSSHYQQTPRPTRGSLQRTDGGHHPPPIYARSGGRGRSTATNSRSASPTKKNSSNRRLSNADAPYEEEEQIEDPEGFFPDDEIVIVERPGHPPAKATNPSSVFTGGVAEGTRAGSARRSTAGSASPQRATTGHVDTKGKGKAVEHDTFPAPEPIFKPRPTRKSTGSTSPMKPISAVGHSDPKEKGKSPERGYIEIDEHLASGEEEYDHHPLPAPPTKKSVIPTSGLSHNVLMCCNTQVVWCVDMKGEKRRMKVRQVELHSDGIVLGDSNVRRSGLYISLSNISGTESCERLACPFIVLNVKTKLSKTKLDSDRFKSLLLPGITESSRRAPTEDEMSTLRFFVHLESGATSVDFIQTHRQLTEFLTYGVKFRLTRQDCDGHRAVGPKPNHDDNDAPAAPKQSLPLQAKNHDLGRKPNQDSPLPRQRARPSVELPSRNPTAKQSARPREKDKERDFEPPKAKPSKIAKFAKTIFDMVPSRQSKRLFGSKTNGSEAEDLCSEDEVIPEPPKTPALAPPPDRGTVLFPYPLTGRATLNITKGELWRVMSGEFLNDTLIEWGLQLLLSDLKGANSESDIHLFNSFFYTKISCKDRDKKLQTRTESTEARWPAYETVRKWTKSVDVFSKKFIIVPINEEYHWYLAVIYNPGLMLVQPPPAALPSSTEKVESSPGIPMTPDVNDENDVDAELGSAREESNPDAPNSIMAAPGSDEPMDGSHVADDSVDELDCIERSPPVNKMKDLEIGSGFARPRIRRPPPPGRPISDPTLEAFHSQHENHASSSRADEATSKPEPVKPVPVKAERPPDHVILDSQKPWIITFDSLGTSHRAVGNTLAQWLQWEARDKKGGNYDHVQVEYTHAQVPLQTNFSDCGLYLVHYARQLLNNPETVLKFVERRLPRKDSDERKQFTADIDTIWGISRDHTLRDEWQAKINSLKEQYEGQKVEKPADGKSGPKVPEDDNVVTEGDSGEGFLDDVNPGNGVVTGLPVLENPAGLEDDRMDGDGDPIEAEKSTGILGTTATAEDHPQSNITDQHTTVAERERSPRPLDSEQDTHIASEANSAMAEQSEEWSDELESEGDEASKANSSTTGTIAEPRPLIEAHNQGRGGSPSSVQDEGEDDAISSILTESTISDDTGDSQAPESNREVDEYDIVDPELGNYAPEQSRPTHNLEDEATDLEPDECYATLPTDAEAGSGNPISSQASVESLRLIKNAGLVHDTNPGPSRIPGKSAEEAIDVSTDEEDNASTAHVPPYIHSATELDVPVSATPTTSRNSTLFKGLTPSSASARKTAVENRQPGTSPLTSLATSRGDADMVPPSFRPDSTSSKRSMVEASAPSSPLTPAGTDFGEIEHVQPPSRSENTSSRSKAKKAPPAARASLAPWQNGKGKGDALHAHGGRQTPVSGRRKFTDLDSDSSVGTTSVRPVTQVYPSMMQGQGSGARQDDVQSSPMPVPMARANSGGLDTLNDPQPTSAKRHMSLDKSRTSQDRSSQSGTPVLGPDSNGPSIEDDVDPADDPISEKPNKPDTSTSSQVSPAKRPKTLDTRNPVRQNRKRPSSITTKDQEMEMDDVESRGEAASLPEHLTSRQLNTASSGSVSAPVSRLRPRSSTAECMLIEENGRPIIMDTREEQYEAQPWLPQNLLDRSEDAGPSTSTSTIPYQRKTKRNTSTAMPQEEEEYFALLDKNGNVDYLESQSDEDFAPKQARQPTRDDATSPPAPRDSHVPISLSDSDDIQHQSELDATDFGGRRSLTRAPRVVHRYGNRTKEPEPKPASLKQGQLPYGTPRSSIDNSAGSAPKTRKNGANQKRQNENAQESSTSTKKKKVIDDSQDYAPAKSSRTDGAKPRKAKGKGRNGARDDGQSKRDAISVDSDGD